MRRFFTWICTIWAIPWTYPNPIAWRRTRWELCIWSHFQDLCLYFKDL